MDTTLAGLETSRQTRCGTLNAVMQLVEDGIGADAVEFTASF